MNFKKEFISIIFVMLVSVTLLPLSQTNGFMTSDHKSVIYDTFHVIIWNDFDDLTIPIHEQLEDLFYNVINNDENNPKNLHYLELKQAQDDYDSNPLWQTEHAWNPELKVGSFLNTIGAPGHAKDFFDLALDYYRDENYDNAWYWLGFALHLVQDVLVPHHTFLNAAWLTPGEDNHIFYVYDSELGGYVSTAYNYHAIYEGFFHDNFIPLDNLNSLTAKDFYEAPYDLTNDFDEINRVSVEDWVHCNAIKAYDKWHDIHDNDITVDSETGEIIAYPIEWYNAAEELAPLFYQTTAGFLFYFWQVAQELDLDNDGLNGYEEYLAQTNYLKADTDGDTLGDKFEVEYLDPFVYNSPDADLDGDGLTNAEEETFNTDPLNSDSDGDGYNDYLETMIYNTDPHKFEDLILVDFSDFGQLADSDRINSIHTANYIYNTYMPSTPESTYAIETYLFTPYLNFDFSNFVNYKIEINIDWFVASKTPIWHFLVEVGNYVPEFLGGDGFTRYVSIGTRDSWSSQSGQFRSFGNDEWRYSSTYNDVPLSISSVTFCIEKEGSILNCMIYKGSTVYYEDTYNVDSFSINTIQFLYKHSNNYFDGQSTLNINSIKGVFYE